MEYLEVFSASYARTCSDDQFINRFYDNFVGTRPEIAEQFKNTNMRHQVKMLRDSLVKMREFFVNHRRSPYMSTLARVHSVNGRLIPRAYYDIWLDCLVDTVRDLDPEFCPDVEYAWRVVMAPGVTFMKNHSPQ